MDMLTVSFEMFLVIVMCTTCKILGKSVTHALYIHVHVDASSSMLLQRKIPDQLGKANMSEITSILVHETKVSSQFICISKQVDDLHQNKKI